MLEFHELCNILPDMPADQFRRLVEDIKAHGLNHEIVLHEGKILDGRHRYRACIELGRAPRTVEFNGNDPLAFVISENLARRHLNETQRAMVAAAAAKVEQDRAHARMTAGKKDPLVNSPEGVRKTTSEKLGEMFNVGEQTVRRALKVREKGAPELVKAAESGDITVNEAARIAELRPEVQQRIVSLSDKRARMAETDKALNRSAAAKTRRANQGAASAARAGLPGNDFIRNVLGRLEHLTNAIVPAETTPLDFVNKFTEEFDWNEPLLIAQLNHCIKGIDALTYLRRIAEQRIKAA